MKPAALRFTAPNTEPTVKQTASPQKGLGDVVHAALSPAVAVIDAVFKTNLKNCGGCAERRQRLNKKMPFKASQ